MSAQRPSFKSYVDIGLNLVGAGDTLNGDEDMPVLNYVDPTLKLVPGETILAEAPSVLKYSLFSEKKKGLNGTLFCTNFRVAYVACVLDDEEPDWKRNHLMGENDIPLSSISCLWGLSKGKRKKLAAKTKLPKRPKTLEIHCADFRVHVFSLQFADKIMTKNVVNEILQVAFPEIEKQLFGFSYKGYKGKEVEELSFQNAGDWDKELRRMGAKNWKTIQVNQSHSLSLVLPEILVVPISARVPDLKQASAQFQDGRLPTWSYTTSNQASLVRMAHLIPETEHANVEEQMIQRIKKIVPGRLQLLDLPKHVPSLQDLKVALDKLRDICLPLSSKDLRETDDAWYSSLEGTRWMLYIKQCLEVAYRMAAGMQDGTSFIIREPGAADFCCVIASLVQLISDPPSRTRLGFEALIRKEWVCMGHRFVTRLGLIHNPANETEQSPIFQFFLDCVWQLTNQFPGSFEFSEYYLTALSDSTYLGVCSEFIFDSLYDAKKWSRECGKYNKGKFLSVWNWSAQFSDKFQTLFVNPVYECPNGSGGSLLVPNCSVPQMEFWSQCYLRWLTPIAILNGGSPSMYLAQCKLVTEIQALKEQVDDLESEPEARKGQRPNLFLSFHSDRSASYPGDAEHIMTSSFPFTPLSPKDEYMAVLARTIEPIQDPAGRDLRESYSEFDSSALED